MPRYIGRTDADWDAMSFDLDTDLALAGQFVCAAPGA
jgi:hypothetical protein